MLLGICVGVCMCKCECGTECTPSVCVCVWMCAARAHGCFHKEPEKDKLAWEATCTVLATDFNKELKGRTPQPVTVQRRLLPYVKHGIKLRDRDESNIPVSGGGCTIRDWTDEDIDHLMHLVEAYEAQEAVKHG